MEPSKVSGGAARLAVLLTCLYFAVESFFGLAPAKASSTICRAIVCLAAAYACFTARFDYLTWACARRKVLALFGVQFASWMLLVAVEFYSFEFSNFDTGIFANQVLCWKETGRYYSSILGTHAFADHFTPNLLLLAPLLSLWKSFLWFPIVKVLAWAWSVCLLALLSAEALGRRSPYRWLVPGIYLVNPFVARTMLTEFQPSSLAIPLVILAFRYAFLERVTPLIITLFVLLGFKEHMAAVWISIGFFLAIEKKRAWLGGLLILAGSLEGLLVYRWLMPAFAGSAVHHDARIRPLAFVAKKLWLLVQAVFSFAGLPLCLRYGFLYALPGFMLVLMGGEPVMASFGHHYHDVGFALLACCSILGLRRLLELEPFHPKRAQAVSAVISLVVLAMAYRFPAYYIRSEWPSREQAAMHRDLNQLRQFVSSYQPQEIWALDHLGPYLFDQPRLKSILLPELPMGAPGEARKLVVVSNLVDLNPLSPEQYGLLLKNLSSKYREVGPEAGGGSGLRVFVSP